MNPDPHSSHYAYRLEGRIESLESKVELLICEVKALRKQQSRTGEKTMSEPTDGGPAFPVCYDKDHHWGGMYLRDYFAAAALTGILSGPPEVVDVDESAAEWAYQWADEMLKEREV